MLEGLSSKVVIACFPLRPMQSDPFRDLELSEPKMRTVANRDRTVDRLLEAQDPTARGAPHRLSILDPPLRETAPLLDGDGRRGKLERHTTATLGHEPRELFADRVELAATSVFGESWGDEARRARPNSRTAQEPSGLYPTELRMCADGENLEAKRLEPTKLQTPAPGRQLVQHRQGRWLEPTGRPQHNPIGSPRRGRSSGRER